MFYIRKLTYIVILIISFALAGCGFHLRGSNIIPPQMRVLYLQSENPYAPFSLALRDYLRELNVHIVNNPEQAPVTLQIIHAEFEKVLTGISSNTLTRTYELVYKVLFQLKNRKGQVILGPEPVVTTTSYTTNATQLLGDQQVLLQQQQEMRRELIWQMLNRLDSTMGKAALAKASTVS